MDNYLYKTVMTEGTVMIANPDTQTLLDAIEMQRRQDVTVAYKTGSTWFFPEMRMNGALTELTLDPDTMTATISFTSSDVSEPHFKNRAARIVYWLWMRWDRIKATLLRSRQWTR